MSLEPASVEKISLRHSYSEIGDLLYEGSVYLDGRPVCDNSWDQKEALVVCRWDDFRNPNPVLPGCLATVRLWLVFNRTFSALRRGPSLLSVTSGDFRMMVSMILLIRAIKIKSILVKGVREMNHTSSVVLTHSFQSVASTRWPVSLASRPVLKVKFLVVSW